MFVPFAIFSGIDAEDGMTGSVKRFSHAVKGRLYMYFFSVNTLSAGYGRKRILEDISFSLDRGCLLGILGANGSGKTTLIKALCSLLPH